ncbi:hypothetical protein GGF37_001902, partial [Kickxella alabastrina]
AYPQYDHYHQPQNYAQPIDPQQQLELELEQQQQQFQQQFLQQYRLVQEQQYQGKGQAEWMHEGFVGHHELDNTPYSLGFQSTPHNPNLGTQYAAPIAAQSDAASNYSPLVVGDGGSSRRSSGRPWTNSNNIHSQQPSVNHLEITSKALHSDGVAASEEDSKSEGSASESSESSESFASNSSDESIYRVSNVTKKPLYGDIGQKLNFKTKTKPKTSAVSRVPSTASNVNSASNYSLAQTSKQDTRNRKHLAAVSGSFASLSRNDNSHNDTDSGGSNSSDDDVPLSVISNSTVPSGESLAAAVRRTKSTAPTVIGSHQRVPDSVDNSDLSIQRGSTKSRSLLVRTRGICQQGKIDTELLRLAKPLEIVRGTVKQDQPQVLGSDDEDAPLDRLKAELESGIRPVPDSHSNSESEIAAASCASPSTSAAASRTHSRAHSQKQQPPARPLPTLPVKQDELTDEPSSTDVAGNESDAASHNSKENEQNALSRESSVKEKPAAKDVKTRRSAGYLPTGMTLPGLPVKQPSSRPRAAVQYVALADIVEITKQTAEFDMEADIEAEDDGFDDENGFANSTELLRRRTIKAAGGVNRFDGCNGATRSVELHFDTPSSSSDSIMEILRAGPVELLTASTDYSGSKAVVDWVVPEDYGDIDQLLTDLDGIMSGSLAARKRFSLALMRRGLAISNGLVEPVDYSGQSDHLDCGDTEAEPKHIIEFKPLEISDFTTGLEDSVTGGGGLGLDELIMSTLNFEDDDGAALDDDSRPLNQLTANLPANLGDLDTQLKLEPLSMPPLNPVELTRGQKVQKALEKLKVLEVRKISIRIYVEDAQRYYTFALTKYTTCEMIINDMKKSGIIDPQKNSWALFELVEYFGIERPLNHFENLMGLVESWEPRSNNYIIVKGFSQQSSLTLLGGVQPGDHAIQGMLYYRVKKNKWQKGVFRLQDHNMIYVKDSRSKSKKGTHYLTLTNNDVYTPFEPLRGAPTRFVFGLKSEMPMQMFEKPDEDYVKWFAVQSLESLREWLLVFRLAKNQIKFRQVLENRVVEASAIKGADNSTPINKPLVDLMADKQGNEADGQGKKNSDFASELVTSINRIAAASKHDPSALVRLVDQGGVDVSDFKEVTPGAGTHAEDMNDDMQANEELFLPGTLLSRPRKTAAEARANQPPEEEFYAKGSLLAQPRESKALAASRAMQNIMAQDGNVFTQGSLLQVTEQSKPRPAHVGGAAHITSAQFPLMQMDNPELDIGAYTAAKPALFARGNVPLVSYDEGPIFSGLMASVHAQSQPQYQTQLQQQTMAGKLGNYYSNNQHVTQNY